MALGTLGFLAELEEGAEEAAAELAEELLAHRGMVRPGAAGRLLIQGVAAAAGRMGEATVQSPVVQVALMAETVQVEQAAAQRGTPTVARARMEVAAAAVTVGRAQGRPATVG